MFTKRNCFKCQGIDMRWREEELWTDVGKVEILMERCLLPSARLWCGILCCHARHDVEWLLAWLFLLVVIDFLLEPIKLPPEATTHRWPWQRFQLLSREHEQQQQRAVSLHSWRLKCLGVNCLQDLTFYVPLMIVFFHFHRHFMHSSINTHL